MSQIKPLRFKTSATVPLQIDTNFSPFFASQFADALNWLKDSDFDGVELAIVKPKEVNGSQLFKTLNGFGLPVTTISTGQVYGTESISLSHADNKIRKKAIKRIRQFIDLAVEINSDFVTIGLVRGKSDDKDKDNSLILFRESLDKCLAYAKEMDKTLLIEPINRYETNLLNSCEETALFINGLEGRNVGILFDAFHSNIEDANMIRTIEEYGKMIMHVHFSDSNRHLPGDGHIDFSGIVKTLEKVEYKGYISLETLNLPDIEYIKQQATGRIKSYLAINTEDMRWHQ